MKIHERRSWTTSNECIFLVAFCRIMAISRQKEARRRDYALTLILNDLKPFKQLEALYMHNHDDKYPARP